MLEVNDREAMDVLRNEAYQSQMNDALPLVSASYTGS